MKYIYFFIAVIFGFLQKGNSQIDNNTAVMLKVNIKSDTLHVLFRNKGIKAVVVLILNYRTRNALVQYSHDKN